VVPPDGEPSAEQASQRRWFHAGDAWSLYDRDKFMALGGFDELFTPFFSEDEDLFYRAWKRGWHVIYEPRARVVHHHECSTIFRAFDDARRERIYRAHQLLHTWKNLDDVSLRRQHLVSLWLRFLTAWAYDRGFYGALATARGKRPAMRASRAQRVNRQSDREVLERMRGVDA
jgi:GT2 family glycosyltransferase